VQNTVRQVFGAFGVAVIGTILATEYATKSAAALAPLPAPARDAASQSIVATQGILARAAQLGAPPEQVAKVRAGAFDAFLSASHITTAISLGVILLAAALVAFVLPTITPPQAAPPGPPPASEEPAGVVPDASA
jgi:hypothetical protein